MKRTPLALSLAALLIGGAGYGAYWHYVAGQLDAGIADWAAQQRTLGHEIAFESDPISGFPLAFRTEFRAVSLIWHLPAGDVSVVGERLHAVMRPWNLQAIEITSDQTVTATLDDGSGRQQQARLGQGTADLALHATGQMRSLSLAAAGVGLETVHGGYEAETLNAKIDLPAEMPADYHQPLVGFDLALSALRLPAGQRALTSGPIESAAATGAVMGPVPFATSPHEALSGWARAGGIVELKSFTFAQAPLTLAGAGTLTLDEALQPLGALTIHAQGLGETIVLLERDGMIDAQSAKTAGMMAKGLAKPDEAGHQVVSVSLSLQQGYLWLGPVKLASLPVLGW
ncbi:MAG: DUF2125 domain-containing protein [Rhodospirillaceae bacterium]|nr:DUF2125 domain-containing protein [Rhodospirillaceae bacterium]